MVKKALKLLGKFVGKVINADTTNPVVQYVLVCFITYGLSLVLSLWVLAPHTDDAAAERALCDCLVPTTVTLTVSVAFQNHAAAAGSWAGSHAMLTVIAAFATFFYMLLYAGVRTDPVPVVPIVLATVTIAALNLFSVMHIEWGKNQVGTP